MPLIPGTLPSDTCYGTPQQLLQLFAQYLDIPAFAVSSKVIYSDTTPIPVVDLLWVEVSSSSGVTSNLKVYNNVIQDYDIYPFQGRSGPEDSGGTFFSETFISGRNPTPIVSGATIQPNDSFIISSTVGTSLRKLRKVDFSVLCTDVSNSSNFIVKYPKLSTSATASDNVAARTAKAWINFNGASPITAGSTRESFNITGLSRTGVGAYTIQFPAMGANTYSYFVHCENNAATPAGSIPIICRASSYAGGSPLVSSINLYFYDFTGGSGSPVDPKVVTFVLFSKD